MAPKVDCFAGFWWRFFSTPQTIADSIVNPDKAQLYKFTVIMQNTQEKADLLKMKVNVTKITKVRADENKIHTGKEWRP